MSSRSSWERPTEYAQANVRVVNLALRNHVVNKGAGALKHRAAELLSRHELAARYLNAGLNLEQVGARNATLDKRPPALRKARSVG